MPQVENALPESTFVDHSARHENGGADEVSVTGLSGLLADAQTPLAHAIPGSHTFAGLTIGHVLRASGATAAAFAAISASDLPTGIDAAKIADGSVSNAEFQYLDDYATIGLKDLTAVEVNQLENIGDVTVSYTQWGYLGALDQGLTQASSPSFAGLTLTGNITMPEDGWIGITGPGERFVFNGSGNQILVRDTLYFTLSLETDANVYLQARLEPTDATGDVYLHADNWGGGDAVAVFRVWEDPSYFLWMVGIDQSDSYKFKIHNADPFAEPSLLELTTSGAMTLAAGLTLGGALAMGTNAISGATSVTATSFVIGANTLTTTEWAFLDGQDQAVKVADSVEFAQVTLTGTGQTIYGAAGQNISSLAAGYMDYAAATAHRFGGAPVYIGSGSPGHTITGAGDLYVADRFEVDGTTFLDSTVRVYATLHMHGAGGAGTISFIGTAGGNGEGFTYKDAAGGVRQCFFLPGSDIVAVGNRAVNGVVQIRANVAAGGGGEVTVVQFEDDIIQVQGTIPVAFNDSGTFWNSPSNGVLAGVTDGTLTLGAAATDQTIISAVGRQTMIGSARVYKDIHFHGPDLERGNTAPDVDSIGLYKVLLYDIGDDSELPSRDVPHDWAAGTDIKIYVHYAINETYGTDSGEVRFQVLWAATPVDGTEALDAPTHSGTLTSLDDNIPAVAKAPTELLVGTIPGGELAAGDSLALNLERVVIGDGNDPTADPGVLHLHVHYLSDSIGAAS